MRRFNQVSSGAGAFIFDTSVPFFDLAYKHEIGPFENFYLAVMIRVTRGRCSRQGDYVKGVIMAKVGRCRLTPSKPVLNLSAPMI